MKEDTKIAVMGSKSLGLKVLKKVFSLVQKKGQIFEGMITFNDASLDRSKYIEIKKFCRNNRIKFHEVPLYPKSLSNKKLFELVSKLKIDLIIMANWYWIIPSDVINLVKNGIYCLHASPLPFGRGFAPLNWAIIGGMKTTAISIFRVVPELDAGPIVYQKEIEILENDNIKTLYEKVENAYLEALELIWDELCSGNIKEITFNDRRMTFYGKRIPKDGLIKWEWDSRKIYNFIRAQSYPYPGAYTYLGTKKIIIEDAEIIEEDDLTYIGTPGQVLKIENKGVYVKCGKGTILIKTIRFNHKSNKFFKAKDVIKSLNDRLGIDYNLLIEKLSKLED